MTKHKRPGAREDARPADSKPGEDVASLINERRKIEEWVAALAAKRDQTPAHVFTRVQGDYDTRLVEIARRLSTHQGTLAEEQSALKKKLAALDETIQQKKDERVEIELRAQVGELEGSDVEDAYRAADERLAKLTQDRSALEADLQRVSDFFAAASGGKVRASGQPGPKGGGFDELSFLNSVVGENRGGAAPSGLAAVRQSVVTRPVQPPKTVDADTAAAAEKKKPAAPAATAPAPAAPSPQARARNSSPIEGATAQTAPEELHSSPPSIQAAPAAAPAADPAPTPPRASANQPAAPAALPPQRTGERPLVANPAAGAHPDAQSVKPEELAVEREEEPLVEKSPARPARATIAMQQASMTFEPEDVAEVVKTNESAPSLLDGIAPAAAGTEKPFAANVVSNNPLSLKSTAPTDVKTLKCRECGAMNDPTEWYCERCGAELSGL